MHTTEHTKYPFHTIARVINNFLKVEQEDKQSMGASRASSRELIEIPEVLEEPIPMQGRLIEDLDALQLDLQAQLADKAKGNAVTR